MSTPCAYCGSDIEAHDPIYVQEGSSGQRTDAGQFCNYACLVAHVNEEGLTDGTACSWNPAE